MGATYTRQSSSGIADGSVIEAADLNAEFDQLLAAFVAASGHTHDGTAAEGGPVTKLLGTAITIGDGTSGTDIAVTFDGETGDGVLTWMEDEDYFKFSDEVLMNSTEKLLFGDTGTYIHQSADGVLDLVSDTEIEINATTIDINGAVDVSGNLSVGGDLDVTGSFDMSDANITNIGSIALDTITNDGTDITLDSSGDIVLDAGGANVTIKDDGTSILDIANNSTDVELTVSTADKNFKIKGTDGASAITALDIDMALAGKATFNGDVVVGGDLTVTGDDITMGTNTAGHLLIADGTNFNSIAAGSLSEISTVASDDVFVAVDTSGGGLKKITRSTLVAGLATSSGISNIVEDTSPQLGGDLDTNSANILIDDAHFIADENGNEQIIFQTTSSAVNQFDVTNAATGGAPLLSATGGDSNIDLEILAKGTGHVTIKGGTNSGAIQFNCESNSHGQIVIAQPHSAAVTNTLTLPAGSSSTLVSLVSTDTLTNKTLTTPVIAEIDSGADITLDATADIILDAGGNDWSFKSGGTEVLKITNSSSDVIIKPIVDAKDIIFQQRDGTEVARVEDNATFNFVTDKLAINGTAVTSTAAELNLLDGVSGLVQADLTKLAAVNSTDAELNLLDGSAKSTSSITLADSDAIIVIDGTTTKQIPASDLKTYNPGGTSWQAVKTANFTASAGQGVFCNTTDSAFTITLPAGTIGDEVSIVDYAGTFDSNNLTVAANGSEKIHGSTDDLTVALERASFTLVFTDSTQGWLLTNN